jgi:hypothetical protein
MAETFEAARRYAVYPPRQSSSEVCRESPKQPGAMKHRVHGCTEICRGHPEQPGSTSWTTQSSLKVCHETPRALQLLLWTHRAALKYVVNPQSSLEVYREPRSILSLNHGPPQLPQLVLVLLRFFLYYHRCLIPDVCLYVSGHTYHEKWIDHRKRSKMSSSQNVTICLKKKSLRPENIHIFIAPFFSK